MALLEERRIKRTAKRVLFLCLLIILRWTLARADVVRVSAYEQLVNPASWMRSAEAFQSQRVPARPSVYQIMQWQTREAAKAKDRWE